VDLQSEYVLEDDLDEAATLTVPQLSQQLDKHKQWIAKFTAHRQWLMDELQACGDFSVFEDGANPDAEADDDQPAAAKSKSKSKSKLELKSGSKASTEATAAASASIAKPTGGEAATSNRNIYDTIKQIIGFEKKNLAAVEGKIEQVKKREQAQLRAEAARARRSSSAQAASAGGGRSKRPTRGSGGGGGGGGGAPDEYSCPITGELLRDPVIAVDGQTYERAAIAQWFGQHHSGDTVNSPMTGKPLPSRSLVANIALRKLVADYVDQSEDRSASAVGSEGYARVSTRTRPTSSGQSSTATARAANAPTRKVPTRAPTRKASIAAAAAAGITKGTATAATRGKRKAQTQSAPAVAAASDGGSGSDSDAPTLRSAAKRRRQR
jgi:hypothetical protein